MAFNIFILIYFETNKDDCSDVVDDDIDDDVKKDFEVENNEYMVDIIVSLGYCSWGFPKS